MTTTTPKDPIGRSDPDPSLSQKKPLDFISVWPEKRNENRYEISEEVSFEHENNFYVGFTADISKGGLFIVTWNTAPIGSHIKMKFTLPNQNSIVKLNSIVELNGIVRWIREHNQNDPDLWPGMGIQFEKLSNVAQKAIESFVNFRKPLFYD